MNVQDVINMALNGQDGRAVEPVEHRTCADEQIAKLASALNFIGANLEDSVPTPSEILAQAELIKAAARRQRGERKAPNTRKGRKVNAQNAQRGLGPAPLDVPTMDIEPMPTPDFGPAPQPGARTVQFDDINERLPKQVTRGATLADLGLEFSEPAPRSPFEPPPRSPFDPSDAASIPKRSPALIDALGDIDVDSKTVGGIAAGLGALGAGVAAMQGNKPEPTLGQRFLQGIGAQQKGNEKFLGKRGLRAGVTAAALSGLGYGAKKLFDRRQQQKNASVDDVLAYAAHVGKQALLEKVAEDRINPAKISAGPAAPYSGEVMPAYSPVFGGQTTPEQLVAMKAQKVRDRINSDMKQYVSNVGDGYNLQGHLNKFNK